MNCIHSKKDLKGEQNAKEISDSLPFIEYELHRQLFNKLKVKGMNAIFGLKTSFSMSDRVMVATATDTNIYITFTVPFLERPKSSDRVSNNITKLSKTATFLQTKKKKKKKIF